MIKVALRKNCDILHFNYVFGCLEEQNENVNKSKFQLNTEVLCGLIRDPSTAKKHFHRTKTFISILKKARKARSVRVPCVKTVREKKYRHVAQLFVFNSLKNIQGNWHRQREENLFLTCSGSGKHSQSI